MIHRFPLLCLIVCLLACGGDAAPPIIDRTLTFEEIDPSIYFSSTDVEDPFADVYAGFRERKQAARQDPEKPPPIEPHPTVHRGSQMPWAQLSDIFRFDWQSIRGEGPNVVAQLEAATRVKRVFDHPDLEIHQFLLGPGATFPAHAEGAPGVFLVIGGEAEMTVGEKTQRVTPGAKVKLEPYVVRQVHVTSDEPLRALWIRWAPHGDHRYIQAGYYLTGANQHVQPIQAAIDPDLEFWGQRYRTEEVVEPKVPLDAPTIGSLAAGQWSALEALRSEIGDDELELYPGVAVFGHESDSPWLDEEAIRNSNFMWAKDVLSTGALLERWAEVVRMEGVFQARHPDGTWDFNISQQAWGSGSRYVEHSHSIPEFYYMLSGRVEHWNGDTRYDAEPGDVFMTNSYQNHESRVRPDGEIWRSYGSTWAPNGDRTVFDRPFFLLAALPQQPTSSALADDVRFH